MENEFTLAEYLSNCQAILVATLISADQQLTEKELLTAAAIYAETFGVTAEESMYSIQAALSLLDSNDAQGRKKLLNEAQVGLQVNLEVEFRQIMFSMLEKVALADGLDSREQELLSMLHSEWELPGKMKVSIEAKAVKVESSTPVLDVFRELLGTAVAGAHLRAIAVRPGSNIGSSERQQIEESFWLVINSLFTLASVGSDGKPVAPDTPKFCATFGEVFKAKESQSSDPEITTFVQLRCDYAILFPEEPIPYDPIEESEEFEDHINMIVEKTKLELDPQWREEMLSPIQRSAEKTLPGPRTRRKPTPPSRKSSGCAIFLVAGIGLASSFLV